MHSLGPTTQEGIGKSTWLQVCLKTDEEVINALPMLSDEAEMTEGMLSTL